ncbi:uncharacterized protein LOC112467577 isoform X2 [Temnothorax curvispinosus]|uniref:Uncharacterized protein LOC112455041 n=1 Tax=Temnothorax curvispinosus TaxID=300111 RepID=A0A6J1R824_9HYME|nr:uncharacterized protein LOC112455041 [Temnothorax curvispinosus]XP_024890358.1 uncharacterized protein LOC112466490 [Temnothorax curvispinosus]XP_024892031.1 uncharacterized protein LOC112467577 isoform X2 [Temnothorax curvispinosus]
MDREEEERDEMERRYHIIEQCIDIVYPAVGWIWVDNVPVREVRLYNMVRVRIPHRQRFIYFDEIRIRGFINIHRQRLVRWFRRVDSEYNEEIWDVLGDEDIFQLRRLFDMQNEFDVEEEEVW